MTFLVDILAEDGLEVFALTLIIGHLLGDSMQLLDLVDLYGDEKVTKKVVMDHDVLEDTGLAGFKTFYELGGLLHELEHYLVVGLRLAELFGIF